ncbi:MAG TPA: hypothetical protein VMU95_40275 [Trebonia sp.]|nr:hypothetical protein [Trebonia sp.]
MSYRPKHAKPASDNASSSNRGPLGIAETPIGRHARKPRRPEDVTGAEARRSTSAAA